MLSGSLDRDSSTYMFEGPAKVTERSGGFVSLCLLVMAAALVFFLSTISGNTRSQISSKLGLSSGSFFQHSVLCYSLSSCDSHPSSIVEGLEGNKEGRRVVCSR